LITSAKASGLGTYGGKLHRAFATDLCEKNVPTLAVDFIFFIDEKIFTVAPPVNIISNLTTETWNYFTTRTGIKTKIIWQLKLEMKLKSKLH